jgi:RNase adapter protein RapZ
LPKQSSKSKEGAAVKDHKLQSLVIITGMSGSGKHTVFKAFEDLGYFCVDNLPTALVPRLIQMSQASGGKIERLAIVVDVRLKESQAAFRTLFHHLKDPALRSTIIFADASDEVLARRYSETRRAHPLAQNKSLMEGVKAERRTLASIRAMADLVIDTSDYTVHDLRNFIYENFRQDDRQEKLHISIVSFGFKHGIPYNSDLVYDVRFLPNPNFVPHLKAKSGKDTEVVEYMRGYPDTFVILDKIVDMLEYLIPKYEEEGKTYLTVAIGCTGGRHRSVMVAAALRDCLAKDGRRINLIHRDLDAK